MTEGIYPVTVPKWGIEMQEGTVVSWHAVEGKEISRGDELVDIETDKIVNTMEAPRSGILRRCLVQEGETLKVGALLGVIAPAAMDDEAINEFIQNFKPVASSVRDDEPDKTGQTGPAPAAPTPPPPAPPAAATTAEEPGSKRVRVSPAAARRARELGIDISKVTGSGRRITPEDVERFAQKQDDNGIEAAPDPGYEAQPLSATRKTIARRLVEAKQQIPHFYLSIEINMDAALERRTVINGQSGQKVSVNDLVMRAVVLALQSEPDVNIQLVGEEIRRFRHVNLAMAVATERGIISPVMHQADGLSIQELAQRAAELGEQARDASLTRENLEGGTFTVSNLGMYGISEFTAIINPPQAAILALGACEERLVPDADTFRKARLMRATMSCDHRAIDGALGAQFLAKLKAILENPEAL